MTLNNRFHLHTFFRSKELNYFYFAVALMTFADSLISVFVPIYFFQLNYPIYQILFFYFLSSFFFVIFSYPVARIVSNIGVKHAILTSTPFLILYYLGLRYIQDYPLLFLLLPLLLSFRMLLYNYGFHLNYITHSDKRKRGREISFLATIAVLVQILSPLIGGFIAFYAGFSILFLLGSLFLVLGTLPLFLSKDKHSRLNFTRRDLWLALFSKQERGSVISFSGYAIESVIGRTLWPIFLIIILVTVSKTGIIVTLSMFASLLVFYFIGKLTDKYNKIRLMRLGTLLYFFAWIGRIFADTVVEIFAIDSYKNITEKILHVPWQAHTYNLAVRKGYYRFLVGREIIFNLSRIVIMPFLILIFYVNYYPFVISFVTAAIFTLGYVFLEHK